MGIGFDLFPALKHVAKLMFLIFLKIFCFVFGMTK